MLHCADCGGPLPQGASTCAYCGGAVRPDLPSSGDLCPHCFARLPEGAKFCITCGTPIRPEHVEHGVPTPHACPRDGTTLLARTLDDLPVEECPQCLGLWIDLSTFRDLCGRKRAEYASNPMPTPRAPTGSVEPVVYLKCPECSTLMNRQNFGRRSGVIVDQCPAHGVWLDDQELERIARFIAEGGLARARAAEAERARAKARAASFMSQGSPPVLTTGWVAPSTGFFSFLADLLWD